VALVTDAIDVDDGVSGHTADPLRILHVGFSTAVSTLPILRTVDVRHSESHLSLPYLSRSRAMS